MNNHSLCDLHVQYIHMNVHVNFFSGERVKVKVLISQESINCIDTHGRTPLMYAVLGKKKKVSTNHYAIICHRYVARTGMTWCVAFYCACDTQQFSEKNSYMEILQYSVKFWKQVCV